MDDLGPLGGNIRMKTSPGLTIFVIAFIIFEVVLFKATPYGFLSAPFTFAAFLIISAGWVVRDFLRMFRGTATASPGKNSGFAALPWAKFISPSLISTTAVARGVSEKIPYTIQKLKINLEDQSLDIPMLLVQATFPTSVNGKIQIFTVGKHVEFFDHSTELESVEFNRDIQVYASTPDLAFRILSPDTMAWYMDLAERPMWVIDGQTSSLIFIGSNIKLETVHRLTKAMIQHLQHSGALEQTAKGE